MVPLKIALRGKNNEFTEAILTAFRQQLPEDEMIFWLIGERAPAADCEAVLVIGTMGADEMDQLPELALIQTISDGYDAVDVDAATERGIWVSYSPVQETGNADSVAQYAVLLILAAARRLGVALRSMSDSLESRPMLNQSTIGMAVCIVGWGSIGQRVGSLLQPFGVTLSAADRKPEIIPAGVKAFPLEKLDDALGQADVTVVCLRGTQENRHLFNAGRFAAMKQGAMLVNVARGTLVDETALIAAVQSGHLGGAGLDVQEHEPVKPGDPILDVPEIFVTPHIAGFTTQTLHGSVRYGTQVLEKYRAGKKFKSILNDPKQPRTQLN
jgi:phosphoglycerate dehydrogenase-like enzyme